MTTIRPATNEQSLCKSFGHLDEHAPVGRIIYFSECYDKPQTFNDAQLDLIIPKQLQ